MINVTISALKSFYSGYLGGYLEAPWGSTHGVWRLSQNLALIPAIWSWVQVFLYVSFLHLASKIGT